MTSSENTSYKEFNLKSMLDIKIIREKKEQVEQMLKSRNSTLSVDELLALDTERVRVRQELETLQSLKNDLNQLVTQAGNPEEREEALVKGKEIKEKIALQEAAFKDVDAKFSTLLSHIPNLTLEDVPVGKDETENVVLRQVGEKPVFDFTPREHFDIGVDLGIMDFERAVKISGARFAYLLGDLVLLELALLQYALSVLTNEATIKKILEEKNLVLSAKPFVPVRPPVLVKEETMQRMARLEPREERYHIPSDNLFLIGSAEHSLGAIHMDETLAESALPLRYVGFSPAFRREAGSYGKDMKGILRVHQFDKSEMEIFGVAEEGAKEQELIVALQEYFMQGLKLPYQVVALCTGDMAGADARQIDIETWLPGQNKYRETHSADYNTDYQARRLNTRVKRSSGKTEFVHMNDATVFSGRPLIAILENYQRADGSVVVPEVLRPWMGKEVIGSRNIEHVT